MALVGLERPFKREYKYAEYAKKCPFFNKNLKKNIDEGKMFAGIRENTFDFYYCGRRVVRRKRDVYKINQFYTDGEARTGSPEISFKPGDYKFDFKRTLGFCESKAEKEKESSQIAKLYKNFSFLSEYSEKERPQLIDIEARFSSLKKDATDKENDKIDLVFFMPKQKALMFVEVKRRLDGRIRAKESCKPEVIGQVARYYDQLQRRNKEILLAYKNVSKIMSDIFVKSFPIPEKIVSTVPVLVVDDPGENSTGSQVSKHTNDVWLEPSLANLGERKIWEKDGIKLIDGRELFYDAEVQLTEFAKILDEIAQGAIAKS